MKKGKKHPNPQKMRKEPLLPQTGSLADPGLGAGSQHIRAQHDQSQAGVGACRVGEEEGLGRGSGTQGYRGWGVSAGYVHSVHLPRASPSHWGRKPPLCQKKPAAPRGQPPPRYFPP